MSKHSFSDIIKYAPALHYHDATGNLIGFVCRRELLHGECAQPMYAHRTHGYVSSATHVARTVQPEGLGSWPYTIAPSTHGPQSSRREPG